MAAPDFLSVVTDGINAHLRGGEWWLAGTIALFISAIVVGLGWMLGGFLRSSQLKAWTTKELEELLISAIILSLLIGTVPFINIIGQVSGTFTEKSYFDEAKNFLFYPNEVGRPSLSSVTNTIGTSIFSMIVSILILAGSSFDLVNFLSDLASDIVTLGLAPSAAAPPALLITAPLKWLLTKLTTFATYAIPFNIWVPYGAPLINLWTALSTVLTVTYLTSFTTYGMYTLLGFFEKTMFTFILPIGLVMRTFPMTRKTGSSLIAIAIVGYIVFPLSIIMNKGIYNEVAKGFPLDLPKEYTQIGDVENITYAPPPNPGSQITRETVLKWDVTREGKGVYRIWAGTLSDCQAPPIFSTQPLLSTDAYWEPDEYKSVVGEAQVDVGCRLWRALPVQNYDSSEPIKFYLADYIKEPEQDNEKYRFIIDAYEKQPGGGYIPIGYNSEAVFVVGAPCRNSVFTYYACLLGLYSPEIPGGALRQAALTTTRGTASGIFAILRDGFFGASRSNYAFAVIRPWQWTANMFLEFTDRLPGMIFPSAMTMFMVVVSLIISVTAYRSIAPAIGGDSDLPGLTRLT